VGRGGRRGVRVFMGEKTIFIVLLLCASFICCVSNNKTKDTAVTYTQDGTDAEYVTWPNGITADAGIPKDVVDMMFKRFQAIENGDIAAFRSTLGQMEDGVDYYYQLGLLFKFFGDLFDIDSGAFEEAVAGGTEELPAIADKLFNGKPPLKNRKTGLKVKKIGYMPAGGLVVTATNNKKEEIEYSFAYW